MHIAQNLSGPFCTGQFATRRLLANAMTQGTCLVSNSSRKLLPFLSSLSILPDPADPGEDVSQHQSVVFQSLQSFYLRYKLYPSGVFLNHSKDDFTAISLV